MERQFQTNQMTEKDIDYAKSAWYAVRRTYSGELDKDSLLDPYHIDFDLEEFKKFVRRHYGDCGWVYLDSPISIPNEWWDSRKTPLVGVVQPPSTEEPQVSARSDVLFEAESLITGDRNHTYGEPTENFVNIATLWTVRLKHKFKDGEELTAADVADLMILLKVARNTTQTKRDNYVDIAGYASCGWEAYLSNESE